MTHQENQIHQEVFDTYSEDRLRLLGYALTEKMKVFPEHNAAYISSSQEELKRFNFKKGDNEGLVNYPLSINGIGIVEGSFAVAAVIASLPYSEAVIVALFIRAFGLASSVIFGILYALERNSVDVSEGIRPEE